MFREGISAVEGDPKKSWSGIETETGVEEVGLEVNLVESIEKKEVSNFLGLRGRYQYLDQRSNRTSFHRTGDRGRGGPNGQIVSIKRAADGRSQKNRRIIDEERKVRGQKRILAKHLDGLERNNFCDFDKPRKRAYQKEEIESNEQSKEGGQPK